MDLSAVTGHQARFDMYEYFDGCVGERRTMERMLRCPQIIADAWLAA